MVIGTKDAFLSWAKNHEGASSLFMMPFVHFDKLCEIYGKKKNRKRGRALVDASDDDHTVGHAGNSGNETQSNTREDKTSITHSTITPPETANENFKKSRGFDPSETEFLELSKTIITLAEAQKDLAVAIINMNNASSHDLEISELRRMLFSVLMNLPGLSPIDVVKAARIIGQGDRKVEVFFSMPDDYKVMFTHIGLESS